MKFRDYFIFTHNFFADGFHFITYYYEFYYWNKKTCSLDFLL